MTMNLVRSLSEQGLYQVYLLILDCTEKKVESGHKVGDQTPDSTITNVPATEPEQLGDVMS